MKNLAKQNICECGCGILANAQEGKCANTRCTATFSKLAMNRKIDGLHVDHDHITGQIRGLLCSGCNCALGRIEDNRDTALSVEYLIHDLSRYSTERAVSRSVSLA